jgi:hypothetical protein
LRAAISLLRKLRTRFQRALPAGKLDGATAEDARQRREPLAGDRDELHEEVHEIERRLRKKELDRGRPAGFVERLAIERAPIRRGYLRFVPGGWC